MTFEKLLTVSSSDSAYNSPLIGNGEVVTTIGPLGYHNGFCPEAEQVNRTIFWAGRRLNDARTAKIRIPRVPPEELIGATIPLVRMGRLHRSLKIDGTKTSDDNWSQTLDPDNGQVLSQIDHGQLLEKTTSFVCLTMNMLVFRTAFSNQGEKPHHLEFTVDYAFGDADGERPAGTRLHIRRPHPDDLTFGNVEGTRSLETDLSQRPPHEKESLSVQYEIERHLGEVHIGRYPNGIIQDTRIGGRFIHQITLEPGQTEEVWFWVVLSDRRHYAHYPEFETVRQQITMHRQEWEKFWQTGRVELGVPKIDALRKTCLYTLRCNASPWTIPPGYLSTHWEGRIFHDEFYPFMAMISGSHPEIARRTPGHRLASLPLALQRSVGNGAYFGWEVIETGEESAPYGHWVDEQFRHGQISESAWRYFLHTGKVSELKRFYPLLKGCADWLVHDVLQRDSEGRLTTRLIADVSEHVESARMSIFVVAATIRSLENAARAAEILEIDEPNLNQWRKLAQELRKNLPVDPQKQILRYAEDVDIPTETAHLGVVYPFAIELDTPRVRNTFESAWEFYQQSKARANSELVFSYNWIWAVGRLAAISFYLGHADAGWEVLNGAPKSIGPFMAPNEHSAEKYGAFLPWLTSGAGAYVYAMNAMFLQVLDEEGAILFPAVPTELKHVRFEKLAADHGVRVSAAIHDGVISELFAFTEAALKWTFRIPEKVAENIEFAESVQRVGNKKGLVSFQCILEPGKNTLMK